MFLAGSGSSYLTGTTVDGGLGLTAAEENARYAVDHSPVQGLTKGIA